MANRNTNAQTIMTLVPDLLRRHSLDLEGLRVGRLGGLVIGGLIGVGSGVVARGGERGSPVGPWSGRLGRVLVFKKLRGLSDCRGEGGAMGGGESVCGRGG